MTIPEVSGRRRRACRLIAEEIVAGVQITNISERRPISTSTARIPAPAGAFSITNAAVPSTLECRRRAALAELSSMLIVYAVRDHKPRQAGIVRRMTF